MNRREVIEQLKSLGASVSTSVTGKTDVLVVGRDRGERKWQDAQSKGVPTMSWAMFRALGFVDKLEGYSLMPIPTPMFAQLRILMAITIEDLYAYYKQTGDERFRRAYTKARRSYESLLSRAYESEQGNCPEEHENHPLGHDKALITDWALGLKELEG